MREIEDRFSRRYGYRYVFFNEEPFTDEFKMSVLFLFFPIVAEDFLFDRRLSMLSSAKMEFGLIPRDHWFQPYSIDEAKAKASRDKIVEKNIIYGGSVSVQLWVSGNCQISSPSLHLLVVVLVPFPPPVCGGWPLLEVIIFSCCIYLGPVLAISTP